MDLLIIPFRDDVPHEVKVKRLEELIDVAKESAKKSNLKDVGTTQLVLLEGFARKTAKAMKDMTSQGVVMPIYTGRTSSNKRVMVEVPQMSIPDKTVGHGQFVSSFQPGDYIEVEISKATPHQLTGVAKAKTTLSLFGK